ncbi:MAG: DNA replication and repair protein RecF [Anaerolineales bacterium]
MLLTHLSLTNFRLFTRLEARLPDGPILLVGANAQGKTSLLEAISYLSSASSPHASHDRQLINLLAMRGEAPFARLVGEVRAGERDQRIEIRLISSTGPTSDSRLQKELLLNGVKKKMRDLVGVFPSVLFLPQDMMIVEGSPSERRRYLDSAIGQVSRAYAEALGEYARALTQRNALLKQAQEHALDPALLSAWDVTLSEPAATVIRERALALLELGRLAEQIHRRLSRGAETLHLEYLPAFSPEAQGGGQIALPFSSASEPSLMTREAIRAGMLEALARARPEELARGTTLIGPHRDDVRFTGDGLDLRMYGSRGQNRTAMLAAKLAEVDWLREKTGETPVLLLDEVLAELDTARREDLLGRVLESPQAVLTSSDAAMFPAEFRRRATIWEIRGGRIEGSG